MLLFWTFLIGIAGATFAIAVSYVSHWYPPEKQGYVLGIVGLGNIGTAVSGFIVPSMVSKFGLSWTFWGSAVLMGLMTVVFWLFTKEAPFLNKETTFKEALSVMKYRPLWILSVFYFLTFGGFVAFSLYLPTLLQEIYHFSVISAGLKTAGFVVIATFIRPLGGYLADRFGAKKILMILFAGIAVNVVLIPFMAVNFVIFSIAFLTLALFLGAGNGAVFKLVPNVSPGKTGASAGIIGAIGGIGGFALPLVLGMTKDITGNYMLGFTILSIYSFICFITTIREISNTKMSSKEKNVNALPSIQ
ncbi:MFS transporter [Pseudalkalibacillus decolorationis]|uniref:MFS transporter n=1 Tax=Pseudalkalibacillus decolorationis TaxID=163879 RepID=UPI0021481F12|nr:MFS transporter [Pseudalkalibacillus decolorationis]